MVPERLTCADDWVVAGEGARNVVLRYRGAELPLTARVLRLPKAVAAQGTDAKHAALERELWQHVPGFVSAAHEAERNWAFVAHVLAPLLGGERYAAAGTLLAVTSAFLSGLARCASCQGTRIGETGTFAVGMDGSAIGVLLPDHTVFGAPTADSRLVAAGAAPVLSVEIKPKCGFLPQTPAVHECAKRHLSRFVMMQHLKAARGQVGALSRYCPLELFSMQEDRMHAALRALLDAPQNNLTVRLNGCVVFGGAGQYGSAPQGDERLLRAALDGLAPEGMPAGQRIELLVRVLTAALRSHGVLQRLRSVQQLDEHDVEGAFQAYCAALGEHSCDAAAEPAVAGLPDAAVQATRTALRNLPRDRALAVLRDFLTAQTAKDCAIMVALQRLPAADEQGAEWLAQGSVVTRDCSTGLRFRSQAAFLDLDAKPVAKMPRYLAQDREVLAHYEQSRANTQLKGESHASAASQQSGNRVGQI